MSSSQFSAICWQSVFLWVPLVCDLKVLVYLPVNCGFLLDVWRPYHAQCELLCTVEGRLQISVSSFEFSAS